MGSYKVEIPDEEYFLRQVNCRSACPVGTNAGGYVALIAAGRFEDAFIEARRPNPFASICGRICAHPCEAACRRRSLDAPLSIRALKRFVTERYGVESARGGDIGNLVRPSWDVERSGKRVAVIGAGPAGLACAHDLALWGHEAVVFDSAPVPGGMLYQGIPEYRLPRDLLLREVEFIESLGVEIRLNTTVGEHVSFNEMERDFDAVFIGAGCMRGRGLNIEGHDLDGVLKAVDFLLNVNLGYKVELGERVLVIGGGNVAYDVARSVARCGGTSESGEEDHHLMMDVARLAVRSGAREVRMVCLEALDEMPADREEIEAGGEEGISLFNRRGPQRIVGKDGTVTGLVTLDVASVFDADGRFAPKFAEGTERVIEADTIILAVGQEADLSFLGSGHELALSHRGFILVDRDTCATTMPGVYAGGDIAFGPRIAIEAVADGRRAAKAIHGSLGKEMAEQSAIEVRDLGTVRFEPGGGNREDYETIPRNDPATIPVERRIGPTEVELGFVEPVACMEGARCLHCWVAPVFDSHRCILCGGCVDVCPEVCLKLVDIGELERDEALEALIENRYGENDPEGVAIIKDEEACIRCGLCARRCPADAITMKSFACQGDLIHV